MNCEEDINECHSCKKSLFLRKQIELMAITTSLSAPCLNGGTCEDRLGGYTCRCVDGFGGPHCADDLDECASSPCLNGATCHDYVHSYTCACPVGFSGKDCHVNDDDCSPRYVWKF